MSLLRPCLSDPLHCAQVHRTFPTTETRAEKKQKKTPAHNEQAPGEGKMKFVHFHSIYQQSCQYAKRIQLTKITRQLNYSQNLNSRISATFLPTIFRSAYFSLTLPSPIFDLNRMNLKKKSRITLSGWPRHLFPHPLFLQMLNQGILGDPPYVLI